MSTDIIRRIMGLERRLDNLARPERGWQPHFLTEPYTNTDFDGDSFSDVAAHTKIENTSWSTTIPTNAKALMINCIIRDSGSAGQQNVNFRLFSTAAATNPNLLAYCGGLANDSYTGVSAVVPCTDGDLWYRCEATGASTLDVWLFCHGYWT